MSGFSKTMLGVYSLTLFLSATLLFLIQLIIAKMITPLMGGTPEVWNTCMVFFQALLLVGYLYAHLSTTYIGIRKQSMIHLGLLLLPFLFFPIAVNKDLIQGGETYPVLTVLAVLALAVGVPFFVVSTSAPLLQRWFSNTDHPLAHDPYFLYAASNVGSMLALLSYPVLTEPLLGLAEQRTVWMVGYGVLAALIATSAWLLWKSNLAPTPTPPIIPREGEGSRPEAEAEAEITSRQIKKGRGEKSQNIKKKQQMPPLPDPRERVSTLSAEVTWKRRLRWVLLAAVPSSLMLGVTKFITTDVTPVPLFWVIPLALYLGTFIIVFSKTLEPVMEMGHKMLVLFMPLAVLIFLFLTLGPVKPPGIGYVILLHLSVFFLVTMVCHGELAADRPAASRLTEFFVWMSFGGVLGGLFNGLVAPIVFPDYYEYMLAIFAACMLLPPFAERPEDSSWGIGADVALMALFVIAGFLLIIFRMRDDDVDFEAIQHTDWRWPLVGFLGFAVLGFIYFVRGDREKQMMRLLDLALPLTLCLLTVGLVWGLFSNLLWPRIGNIASMYDGDPHKLLGGLTWGIPVILCFTFIERPLRFGLGVGAILMASCFVDLFDSTHRFQDRGFFGVLQVSQEHLDMTEDVEGEDKPMQVRLVYNRLMHGTTTHGVQYVASVARGARFVDPDLREEPLTYYHRTGPVGQVMTAYNTNPPLLGAMGGPFAEVHGWEQTIRPLGVIGLGTGTMACYARPGQQVTFYDIDPLVKQISYDTDEYFTYVRDARERGTKVDLLLNDARLAIERQVQELESSDLTEEEKEARRYGILVVDAFSSDAIPIHLITREALQLYLRMVRKDGIIAFHISNRYLDLEKVVANLTSTPGAVRESGLRLACLVEHDGSEHYAAKYASTWAMVAREPEHLARLTTAADWSEKQGDQPSVRESLKEAVEYLTVCTWPDPNLGYSIHTLASISHLALSMKRNDATVLQAPWYEPAGDPKVGVWTDDYCSVWRVFSWR